MIDELPDELRILIAAEQRAPVASDAARALVRTRLARSLGHAAPASALAIKLLGILLVTFGSVVIVGRPETTHAEAPTLALAATPQDAALVEIRPEPPVPTAPVRPDAPPTGRQRGARLARSQASILAEATRALTDGDGSRVLVLVAEDRRAHRDGPLAEEREALRLSALLVLDRSKEARAAAHRFLARYPTTSHKRLVDRALEASR